MLLAGCVGLFAVVFGRLCYQHQRAYGNFGFDLGIYDQGIWLLSELRNPFVTVRGLHLFGHHVNVVLLAFVPFYWFGAGAGFLAVSEAVLTGLAAVPLFLLARDRLVLGTGRIEALLPAVLAAAFLLHPSIANQVWWTFHPDTLAIGPVLWTWLFATRRRWRPALVWALIALLCKEDIALTLAAMGVVLALRERNARFLAATAVAGTWFVVATRGIIPLANGGLAPFYVSEFAHLGTNSAEIAWNTIRHPSRWLGRFAEAGTGEDGPYWWQLAAPFATVPLWVGPELLLFVPQFFVNSVTLWVYAGDAKYHYSAMPVAALAICAVECLGRVRTTRLRVVLAVVVLGAAALTHHWWAASPWGDRNFLFQRGPHPHQVAVEAAIARIPADASVSTVFYLVPQLTHREEIYEFPTPFRRGNYRVPGEVPPDPSGLDFVLLDANAFQFPEDRAVYERMRQPGSGFRVVSEQDSIVLFERTADPVDPAIADRSGA